jgi:hypothetical protein
MRLVLKSWSRTRVACAAVAAASLGVALWMALHHPISPLVVVLGALLCFAGAAAWRNFWLVAIPAALPWLDFSPWTGWLVVSEFDIFLCAVFAGAYLRLGWATGTSAGAKAAVSLSGGAASVSRPADRVQWVLLAVLALTGLLGLGRGLADAGSLGDGWYQGYTDPLNSLRVAKSLFFGLMSVALCRSAIARDAAVACRRLAKGILLGLVTLAIAVVWERLAYPGFFDFETVYRATGLFWEMHVGGGAIDAYLALAMPFGWWFVSVTHKAWSRIAALGLMAALVYACIVTFSRNVYLAVALPALFLAIAAWFRPHGHSSIPARQAAGQGVGLFRGSRLALVAWLLLAAGALALPNWGAGSFLLNRLENTGRVLDARLIHWKQAFSLPVSVADGVWGVGLGRFPARYDRDAPEGQLLGQIGWHAKQRGAALDRDSVKLWASRGRADTVASYGLTQRVPIIPGVRYQVEMDMHATTPTVVAVEVCERHLLYDWDCQYGLLDAGAGRSRWSRQALLLQGPVFHPQPWYARRMGMLMLTIFNAGGEADISRVSLKAGNSEELIRNGEFGAGTARWFPAAQYHYLPWHADSLYLELLVERGWAGLLAFLGLILLAFVRLSRAHSSRGFMVRFLVAALMGGLLVGVFGSVMDAPRVAFLLYFLALFAIQLPPNREKVPSPHAPGSL